MSAAPYPAARRVTEADLDAAIQARQQPGLRRFLVSIMKESGAYTYWRVGGHAMDHTQEAMERAGLGAVIRVQPMPAAA